MPGDTKKRGGADENEKAEGRYTVDEIIGHMRTKDLLAHGSTYPYDEEDLKESKCKYAFMVSWVGYEGEDTWQSYESFNDKKLPKNYGRMKALELFPSRQSEFSTCEDIRRRVVEIEEAQRQRHGSALSHSDRPSLSPSHTPRKEIKGEVITLSSEDDDKPKHSGEEDNGKMKRMNDKKVHIEKISNDSQEVITYDNIPGFKIYLPIGKNLKLKDTIRSKIHSDVNDNKEESLELAKENEGKEYTQFKSKKEQREEIELKKEEEKKRKKKMDEHKRRKVIESSEENSEEKETKRRKKSHSSDEHSESNLVRRKNAKSMHGKNEKEVKVKNDTRRVSSHELRDMNEERRSAKKKKKGHMSDDEDIESPAKSKRTCMKKEEGKQKREGRMEKDSRRSMDDRSTKEHKKKSTPKKESSSDESSPSDESGDEEWTERIITHVAVNEVRKGRDIDGKDSLNWHMINKTKLPFVFRLSFTHPKRRQKKFEWLTIEELDNLPELNRYASTAKINLPKDYTSMMKKKEKKSLFGGDDDLFEA